MLGLWLQYSCWLADQWTLVTSLEFKAVALGFTHSLQELFMFHPVLSTLVRQTKTSLLHT
jgi:hypothetical protein